MKHLERDAKEFAVEVTQYWLEMGDCELVRLKCEGKIRTLLDKYALSTVAKTCVQIYREALMELMQITEYTQKPICYISVPRDVLIAVNERTRDTVEAQRDELIPITYEIVDEILEKAVFLVKNEIQTAQDAYDKAVGLCILTGRRCYSEILGTAEFTAIGKNHVLFSGQAKGGEEKRIEGYQIPVLGTTSDVIVTAQEDLQSFIRNRPWYREGMRDTDMSGRCKRQIQASINLHINPIFNEMRNSFKIKEMTSHDLRKIAAAIAHGIHGERKAFTAFAADYLGHNTYNEVTGKKRRDTKTSESYEKFVMVESLAGWSSNG